MHSHPSVNNHWLADPSSNINTLPAAREPCGYSIAPSSHVCVSPIQDFSSVCGLVKMGDDIDGRAGFLPSINTNVSNDLSNLCLNGFGNHLHTDGLTTASCKSESLLLNMEHKLNGAASFADPLTYSMGSQGIVSLEDALDQEKLHSLRETAPAVLSQKRAKKPLQTSKMSSQHKEGRKGFSMELIDSLQITTGISGKPYSYAQLITYAIATSSTQKMTLSELYKWCMDNFPYFKETPSQGWKNSIRHNLSLNRNFVRIPRPVNEPGKGSYWTLNRARIKSEMKTWNRTRNHRRSSTSSSNGVTFDRIVNLDGKNDACEFYNSSLRLPQQTMETLSQPKINCPDDRTFYSTPDVPQVFQPYVTQGSSISHTSPASVSLPMQPYNISHCDVSQQANAQPYINSTCYDSNNKTQDDLLFNLLQYQQFKIPQSHKTVECENGISLDRPVLLCQSEFQPLMEEISNYDDICFTQEREHHELKDQQKQK